VPICVWLALPDFRKLNAADIDLSAAIGRIAAANVRTERMMPLPIMNKLLKPKLGRGKVQTMRSSAWTEAADHGVLSGLISGRIFLLLAVFALAILPASGQTNVAPTTNTILFSGPDQAPGSTAPQGAIVLYGTAISSITGQPVRHLWVADSQFAICRMDPELDAPGPWSIAPTSCQYSINRQGGAIPLGGPLAFDPAHNFLYFVDNNTASQGVIRIGYKPDGDNGQGAIDVTTAFTLAGGQFTRKGPFAGGTGCPYPGPAVKRARPNGVALSPLGDLWVG